MSEPKPPAGRSPRRALWWYASLAALAASGAVVAARGGLEILGAGSLLAHLALGLVLAVPCLLWRQRRGSSRGTELAVLGGGLLAGAAAAGLLAMAVAAAGRAAPPWLLAAHVWAGTAGLVALVVGGLGSRPGAGGKLAAAVLCCLLLVPPLLLLLRAPAAAGRGAVGVDWRPASFEAPLDMAGEAMGGESGPFFPSAMHTTNGGRLPAAAFAGDARGCAGSGCHPDVVRQWESSAHHLAAFDDPFFAASLARARAEAGVVAARWCAGCHSPLSLLTGAVDRPLAELAAMPAAHGGVTCLTCHAMVRPRSTMGQADYELAPPPLGQRLGAGGGGAAGWLHQLLVRLDPDAHRGAFAKPFLRGSAAFVFCSTCHRGHVDWPVNGERFRRTFDDYRSWHVESNAEGEGTGVRRLLQSSGCNGCHMPRVRSRDSGNRDGWVHSHRFAAANTALPALRGDREQLAAVVDSLRSRQVSVDIFAIAEPRAAAAKPGSFGWAEKVEAPLDRVAPALRPGESRRLDVVVRNRGVGHPFPGGKSDLAECWLELEAKDDLGRTVFSSGALGADGRVDPSAHFFRTVWSDGAARAVTGHAVWAVRALVYQQRIEPEAAAVVRYRLQVPRDASRALTFSARLNYRKVSPDLAAAALQRGGAAPPQLPVVTLAEQTLTLPVAVAAAGTVRTPSADGLSATMPAAAGQAAVLQAAGAGTDAERFKDYALGLELQGDFPAARAALARALVLAPRDADARVTLALAAEGLDPAHRLLREALAIDPGLARTHFYLALVERQKVHYASAVTHLRAAAALFAADPEVRRELATTLILQGDVRAAVTELRRLLAIDPEDAGAHLKLRQAYLTLGDRERARRHLLLYERFRPRAPAPDLLRRYLTAHPDDERERQGIHEHASAAAALAGGFQTATAVKR
jgi:tetratricopeptide (TPR) repeat protein